MTLSQQIPDASTAVMPIRPRIIFEMIEEQFPGESVEFRTVMPPTLIGSVTLLEGAILAALIRLIDARRIFEFGTYLGYTSTLLAMNSHPEARITTLDITPDDLRSLNGRETAGGGNDDFLREQRTDQGAIYIEQAEPKIRNKIDQVFNNSLTLDVERQGFRDQFDLIFIDGGHDRAVIENDTKKAFQMAHDRSVIVWHDYNSKVHTDVTDYVDEISRTHPILHIEASMLAVHWRGLVGKFE